MILECRSKTTFPLLSVIRDKRPFSSYSYILFPPEKLLGNKISKIRKEKGYSQIKFAELLGISTNALSLIETGNGFCTAETLEKILINLDLEPNELFSFDTLKSNEEIYNNIIKKLNIIKSKRENLEIIDTILNKLL